MAVLLQWQQTWNGSVLNFTETWGEGSSGALDASSSASVGFAGLTTTPVAASFSAAASFVVLNSTYASGQYVFNASTGVLWDGTEKLQARAVSFAGTASFGFLTDVGSAFSIVDAQTEMFPSAGSVANADVVGGSSLLAIWNGNQVAAYGAFSIPATAVLTADGNSYGSGEFAAAGTVSVSFAGAPFVGGANLDAAAVAITWSAIPTHTAQIAISTHLNPAPFATYSRASGAVSIGAAAFAEFGQTAGATASGAAVIAASAAFGSTGESTASAEIAVGAQLSLEFGRIGGDIAFGGASIVSAGSIEFGTIAFAGGSILYSPAATFRARGTDALAVTEDDDIEEGHRRDIWHHAAQSDKEREQERLARIARYDAMDLEVLTAALVKAVEVSMIVH